MRESLCGISGVQHETDFMHKCDDTLQVFYFTIHTSYRAVVCFLLITLCWLLCIHTYSTTHKLNIVEWGGKLNERWRRSTYPYDHFVVPTSGLLSPQRHCAGIIRHENCVAVDQLRRTRFSHLLTQLPHIFLTAKTRGKRFIS